MGMAKRQKDKEIQLPLLHDIRLSGRGVNVGFSAEFEDSFLRAGGRA
jgi:hypothetical protein